MATLYNQNNVSDRPRLLRPLHQMRKEYRKDTRVYASKIYQTSRFNAIMQWTCTVSCISYFVTLCTAITHKTHGAHNMLMKLDKGKSIVYTLLIRLNQRRVKN